MIVMKFGGTSVGSAERIQVVRDIVKSQLDKKPVVVCSAVGGVTDLLIAAAEAALKGEEYEEILNQIDEKHYVILDAFELEHSLVDPLLEEFKKLISDIAEGLKVNDKTMDLVQSFGERMSVQIVAAYLTKEGIDAKAFFAYDIGMTTDSNYGAAEPLEDTPDKIAEALGSIKEVPIITGFIGKNLKREITTLGRGGSDYTAAIIGAAVNAEEIQIWTDVDGLMTADPRIVKDARVINKISFAEARELAFFGAKVLHPKTILPAVEKNIPVKVLNTHNLKFKGTTIVNQMKKVKRIVKALSRKKEVYLIDILSSRMLHARGFMAKLFSLFEKFDISVDVIATTEVSVSVTVDKNDNLDFAIKELEKIADVSVKKGRSIICAVGEGMRGGLGVAGKIFTTVGDLEVPIEMISQGASEISITFIIEDKYAETVLNALHAKFIEPNL